MGITLYLLIFVSILILTAVILLINGIKKHKKLYVMISIGLSAFIIAIFFLFMKFITSM